MWLFFVPYFRWLLYEFFWAAIYKMSICRALGSYWKECSVHQLAHQYPCKEPLPSPPLNVCMHFNHVKCNFCVLLTNKRKRIQPGKTVDSKYLIWAISTRASILSASHSNPSFATRSIGTSSLMTWIDPIQWGDPKGDRTPMDLVANARPDRGVGSSKEVHQI
jgi:hypothetical protein